MLSDMQMIQWAVDGALSMYHLEDFPQDLDDVYFIGLRDSEGYEVLEASAYPTAINIALQHKDALEEDAQFGKYSYTLVRQIDQAIPGEQINALSTLREQLQCNLDLVEIESPEYGITIIKAVDMTAFMTLEDFVEKYLSSDVAEEYGSVIFPLDQESGLDPA